MKPLILILLLLCFFGKANAQLTSGEYFFDTAPAVGGGTAFSFTSANNINQTLNMPIASLASGFHNVFIRVKDGANTWSHYEGRTFYIIPTVILNPQPQLTAGEWFLDTDPGIGNGTAITFAQGNTVNSTIALNDAALVAGFHNLFIRVKDASNIWSHYEGRTFYVIPTTTNAIQPNLVAGEWFLDTDPGLGNGTAINFTASDVVNPIIAIPSGNLSVGIHHLFIRVRDANGVWSHYEGRQFTNDPLEVGSFEVQKIKIYPNPTNSILNIQTDKPIQGLKIVDIAGRTTSIKIATNNTVNVSGLSSGIYFIEVKTDDGFTREKFIKN